MISEPTWEPTAEELLSEDVEMTKIVESESEEKSDKEKLNSEELPSINVLANQNSPRDAEQTSKEEDAQEDTTDVQEDAWEELADLVLE